MSININIGCIFILYLGEVIHTLLEGVHNDVVQLSQSF